MRLGTTGIDSEDTDLLSSGWGLETGVSQLGPRFISIPIYVQWHHVLKPLALFNSERRQHD